MILVGNLSKNIIGEKLRESDTKIKYISELIEGIRLIKMYVWE